MSSVEERNNSVVLKYFDGCNTGNIEELLSTLDPAVITTSCLSNSNQFEVLNI